MQVIPLYKPEAVFKALPLISSGIERVLEFSKGDEDLTQVFNRALAGELLIWLVLDKGNYCGFSTTSVNVIGTNPVTKYVVVNHTYKCKEVEQKSFLEALDKTLTSYAKEHQCSSMRIFSTRALRKMVANYGYKPSFTEYIKEI